MEATATRVKQGRFLWHELVTHDVSAAIDFYEHVVGWTTQSYDFGEHEGPAYTMWMAGDSPIGGVMEIDEATMGEIPPMWLGYVHALDVDKSIRRARELGGSVVADALDVPTVGRMAGLRDRQGAAFWVLSPERSEPMPEPPRDRSVSWNELATTDSEAALEFYRQLLGWEKMEELEMGDGWMYRMFGQNGKMYGGIYNKPPDMSAPPHWMYYVMIDDLDDALRRAVDRGGKVLNGPMEVPGGDRVAACTDPQGARFGLHEAAG